MNPQRPRSIVKQIVKWAWLGLARGQIDKNVRRGILMEVSTHAWFLGLHETQQERLQSKNVLRTRQRKWEELHRNLRLLVMQALAHWVYQVPLYKFRYDRYGILREVWRR